jgi:predicted nuclease of restriction endonuclease-like (RecB) superfamily
MFGYVPWGHHVEIVTKCKTIEEALFYVQKTIEENWSRSVLVDCMKVNLYHSSGNA